MRCRRPNCPVADTAAGEPVAELADGIDAAEALIQKLAAGDDPVTCSRRPNA